MKRLRSHARPLLLALLLALASGTAAASQVVVVTPTIGNPVQSGNDFKAAHDAITGNAWSRRFLVLLEPGVYDLGNQNIQMKDYVDIAGSGVEITFVYGNGNTTEQALGRGLFQGARNNELRDLSIRTFASVERPWLIPIYLSGTHPNPSTTKIRNVRTQAFGTADYCTGIEGFFGSNIIEDVQIRVQCTGTVEATGIVFSTGTGGLSSGPTIRRADVIVSSDSLSRGFFLQHVTGYSGVVVEDSTFAAGGSGLSAGLYHRDAGGGGAQVLTITDTTFTARGSGINRAVWLETAESSAVLRHSRLLAVGGTQSTGVYGNSTFVANMIENSIVSGGTNAIDELGSSILGILVGNSKLEGGPVTGTVTCAGAYDENFTFFPGTCP